MIANSVNSAFNLFGLLVKPTFPSGIFGNIGSGDVDLYTVPSGRSALIGNVAGFNTAGTSTTILLSVKIGGTYYRIQSAAGSVIGTLTGMSNTFIPIVISSGESLAVNTSQAGMNLNVKLVEFDAQSSLKTYRILGLSNGDNTVISVPTGKSIAAFESVSFLLLSTGQFHITNSSGGARNYIAKHKPNGGASFESTVAVAVADGGKSTLQQHASLSSGDELILNTDSGAAGQNAWINVIEI